MRSSVSLSFEMMPLNSITPDMVSNYLAYMTKSVISAKIGTTTSAQIVSNCGTSPAGTCSAAITAAKSLPATNKGFEGANVNHL